MPSDLTNPHRDAILLAIMPHLPADTTIAVLQAVASAASLAHTRAVHDERQAIRAALQGCRDYDKWRDLLVRHVTNGEWTGTWYLQLGGQDG